MIIKCSNCNSALIYDIKSGKMKCESCNSLFSASEVNISNSEKNMMEGEVYVCTACGAKVIVNNVECATHCAYCGQPTVIFERVSKFQKPEKIIPFKVTKEEAIKSIRKKMEKGFFIPKSIKFFEIERILPIYVPFWLFDVKYHDNQVLMGTTGKIKDVYYRNETVLFHKLTVDASSNFCNESSQRLEPYDMKNLVDFEEAYISGFYADCYDEMPDELHNRVYERCKAFYDKESEKSTEGSGVRIESSDPDWEVLKETYAMLPAWFLTLRYKKKPYTILVNGQTGKLVGAVPYVKAKVFAVFLAFLLFFLLFVPKLCSYQLDSLYYNIEKGNGAMLGIMIWMAIVLFLSFLGRSFHKSTKKHIRHASDKKMTDFSKDRDKR